MNRRLIGLALGIGLIFGANTYTQAAIAPSVKVATSISDADRAAIKQSISSQADALAGTDTAAQSAAREGLIKDAGGDPPPTAVYLDAYAQAINDAMLALADNPALRTRLNAAIVVARVAERTGSLRLKPAAIKFRQDKSEAVMLWGVKAHKPLILAQLRSQVTANEPLITGLPQAIKDHLSAPIAQEAYESLTLDLVRQRASLTDAMYKAVVPAVQDLLTARAAMYKNGMPDVPQVDTLGTLFITDTSVWRAQTDQQKVRTAQLVCDLIAGTGQRAAVSGRIGQPKDGLMEALRLFAGATQVLGQSLGKPAIQESAATVYKLETSADGQTIIKACDALIVAVSAEVQGVKRVSLTTTPALP